MRLLFALLLSACTAPPVGGYCDLDMARAHCGWCNAVWCTERAIGEYGCTQAACIGPPPDGWTP